ncbi:unnamed protein product [Rotaria sordida]|uniref:Tubulin epsilon chain n=1 Tax=Rotaria sordida TaxID=392033 RepID=A0A813SZK6_9BILA|nr:unnamed protein product [Rotaria sordida]CAF3704939.1 unnamed protein product [Rotaria sordida]
MAQNIIVQVGQCGSQIGCRFWDLALREHASLMSSTDPKKCIYDASLSAFFRNVDENKNTSLSYPSPIRTLKARAVLVDMEEGVLRSILASPLRDLFDGEQFIRDVSGAGNNWAVGNRFYGEKYRQILSDEIRRQAEQCDSLQSFMLIHSMGGGTGSGLGTFILSLLDEMYPKVCRIVTPIYPSKDDDVITSPYNSVLATRVLTEHADCVLPVDNDSLIDIVSRCDSSTKKNDNDRCPFDSMNTIVANLILNLTSSSRFDGPLNVDLSEIPMNLVPYPRMHYLISSQIPAPFKMTTNSSIPRNINQIFRDALSPHFQTLRVRPQIDGIYIACGMILRSKTIQMSDIRRNIDLLKLKHMKFVKWNEDGWKVGLCIVPPNGLPYSLLTLANHTCIKETFSELKERFTILYRRKAHVHHYTDHMELGDFEQARENLNQLIEEYKNIEQTNELLDTTENKNSSIATTNIPRLNVLS